MKNLKTFELFEAKKAQELPVLNKKDVEKTMEDMLKKKGFKVQWVSTTPEEKYLKVVVRLKGGFIEGEEDGPDYGKMEKTCDRMGKVFQNWMEVKGVEFNPLDFEIYGTDSYEYYTSLPYDGYTIKKVRT